MKVHLVNSDPHPFEGAENEIFADWWGKEIEIGTPKFAEEKHACGTSTIWPVIGPPEFVDLLRRNKSGRRFVCIHLIRNGYE